MALVPANATLASWIGTGAGTTASSTTAGAGYWIPKALVDEYVGAGGTDTNVSDDIRDFLFSVLSKIADTNSQEISTSDTRPTTVSVSRVISTLNNRVTFSVTLNNVSPTSAPTYIASLPSYA